MFNFDRTNCDIMAQQLLSRLEKAEREWRVSSAEWKAKIKELEAWKSRSKERERNAEKAKKQKKNTDERIDIPSTEFAWQSSFDPEAPSEGFSFAGRRPADLEEDIEELARWTGTQPWVLQALRRGIAVHHAGMNKRYRSLIER